MHKEISERRMEKGKVRGNERMTTRGKENDMEEKDKD